MMKNVRISKNFLTIIDDLVDILKNDVSKIEIPDRDYSCFKKYTRTSIFEKLVLRSFPYYIDVAKSACLDSGNFTAFAKAQNLDNRFLDYNSNLYDANNSGKDTSIVCGMTIEKNMWESLTNLSKTLSAGIGMEANLSNVIKGCVIKGVEFFITMAEEQLNKGCFTVDFSAELSEIKTYVSERISQLDKIENIFFDGKKKLDNIMNKVVKKESFKAPVRGENNLVNDRHNHMDASNTAQKHKSTKTKDISVKNER